MSAFFTLGVALGWDLRLKLGLGGIVPPTIGEFLGSQ